MAAPKKKPSSKAKTTAKKKTVVKKTTAKKKGTATKKTTAAARKKATTTKRVRKTVAKKAVKKTTSKSVNKPNKPRSWWSVLTFGVVALGIAAAGYLSANPELLAELQANLIAQTESLQNDTDTSETPETIAEKTYDGGVLITWSEGGENELKLIDIFRTVFPETSLESFSYDSEEGKKLMTQFSTSELPALYYAQGAFENETLSEVVKDLFALNNGYYSLNVSLVNPSYQWHVGSALNTEGAVFVGNTDAPLTIVSYSDPKCQHCRVDAQNNLDKWKELIDEGMVQIAFIDLPQSTDSHYHAVAMACVGKLKPAEYLGFRADLFNKANLSKTYTERILKRMDISYEDDCNEADVKRMIRQRVKVAEQDGITGVPALYIHKTEETNALRITGAKEFSEYQAVLDKMMGTSVVPTQNEDVLPEEEGADDTAA